MKKLIIALGLIAVLIGGYRLVSSRKKEKEEKPAEFIEIETFATPTPGKIEEKEGVAAAGQDLPSAGVSADDKEAEIPSQKEMEKIIKEFREEK